MSFTRSLKPETFLILAGLVKKAHYTVTNKLDPAYIRLNNTAKLGYHIIKLYQKGTFSESNAVQRILQCLAAPAGFEPANAGVKFLSLPAWR